ncbi:MAG: hypothetical protein ACTSWY_07745 [Promethearchaeota archaeon]
MGLNKSSEYKKQNEYDVTKEAVKSTLNKMDKLKKELTGKTVFLGFDGYIDSLYSMVSERKDAENWIKMDSMKEFGSRINSAAGSSANIERVLKKRIAGGFAPNMARAISNFGSNVILAAAMGLPKIDPLFKEFSDKVELKSIKNIGETAGFEFEDGKVMCTDFGNINSITWDTIMEHIPRDEFIGFIEKCNAIGQGHWALVPHMNDYWEKMIEEIFPNVSNTKDKIFLVDVADIKKRTNRDINKMLKLLQKVDEFMPAVLSMNDRETVDISNVLSSEDSLFERNRISPIKNNDDFFDFGQRVNEILELSYIITHDPHFATITTKNKHIWITEGYTSKPKFTTAAGDHFNGGTLLSLVCDLNPEESLVIGNALTAIFVRTGVSVGVENVKKFIESYFSYILNDISEFQA